ncbi:ParB/RepB/Spo0J family partition protein [Plantibacter sp. CFBP 8804]|uniref:ParB/RepB/Spo0J family partition protein n=1 Tax=Plantibacter sp. CFBP 8804 TaxID=2775270 RepID=UPI00178173B8|nr:ParB N-terminal domain-containing protein [Plantibacter sp. CFBP 8804]
MTKNTTTTQPATEQTAQAVPAGVLEHLDPQSIIVETNVRTVAPLTPEFIDGIRRFGVMQPVVARRDEHGNVLVRMGQRRTLAAREAQRPTIPVYVVEADEATTERIVAQMIENEHRTELSDADRVAAWQQLSFEGMDVATIAKQLGTAKARVTTGLALAEHADTAAAMFTHQLTLEQGAALLDFADDQDVTAQLIEVATTDPEQFEHAAQRARNDRHIRQLVDAATEQLTGQGFAVVDYVDWSTGMVSIAQLATADGEPVTPETVAEVEGRTATVNAYAGDAEASIRYYIPKSAKGFRDRYASTASKPAADELTPEEREAKKQERRQLIANNKAWDAAQTVRRDWLANKLRAKTLPKGAAKVIADGLTTHRHAVSRGMDTGNRFAHELLGVKHDKAAYGSISDRLAASTEKNPTRAQYVALAIVLAGIEESTGRHTWRQGGDDIAAYFRQLAAWGYPLSDVERIAAKLPADS